LPYFFTIMGFFLLQGGAAVNIADAQIALCMCGKLDPAAPPGVH